MQLKGKKVLVFGAARSGISAAIMLQKLQAEVILFDCNTKLTKEELILRAGTDLSFPLITGSLSEEIIDSIELLILSPGVPLDHPEVLRIKAKDIPIWGEIELAYRYAKGKIIGITGTNGKTTTTTLVGEIMKTYYDEVYVVGNIGNAFSDIALSSSEHAVIVIELSSFQLETIHEFKTDISTILNITPDHLDRHHSMENYIAAKENITKNQTETELCILNYEDAVLREMAERLRARVVFFSSRKELKTGLCLKGEDIVYRDGGKEDRICNIYDLRILGKHNYENVMVAAGIGIAAGVPIEYIRKALSEFKAVEHRIEYVESIKGVDYYNDSKGTNPDASIKAIEAMVRPTVLIAGGYDKHISFDDFVKAFQDKVKLLVLFGQTREQIAKTAYDHGFQNIIMVKDLAEAVKVSAEKAEAGDAVLLSPACASWGLFDNFEQRGNLFKEYVRQLLDTED